MEECSSLLEALSPLPSEESSLGNGIMELLLLVYLFVCFVVWFFFLVYLSFVA